MTSASSSATPSVLHPKYRPDIDGLRALAVLSVVGFHAFPGWVRGGFIGVDVFFVISGFLISTIILQSLQKGSFSFKDFYVRRVRRIFPALVVVLIVTYSFGWFALLADEYKQFGKHVVAGAGFVSNFALWRESGYFDNAAETKPLLHLWSLGIEEQFYILWPLILWLGWKLRVNLLVWIVLIAIASFALNLRAVGHDAVAAFYSPQTRFWELLSGAGLAWVALNRKWEASGPVSDTLSVFGTLVLAVGFWKISRSSSFPGVWALFPVFGAVLIISAGPQGWLNRQVYSNRVAVWFGLISFPLYLWHWPIFSFLRIIQGQGPAIGVRVVGVLLSVALAWLTYRFLERPLRFGRYRNLSVSFLIAPMMAIAALGYQAYARDGFQGRASVRGFVNNKNELLRISALDSECLSYVGIEKPLFPYCRFSQAGGTETVAVIGDSHAHVAYPGIAEFLRSRGVNTVLLANSSCPPFFGVVTGANESEREACAARIRQLIATVEKRVDIKKVFIFSRGTIYATGTEPMTGPQDVSYGSRIPMDQLAQAAQKTIDALVSSGKRVFYVTENPELQYPADACLTRPFNTKVRECSVPRTQVLERQGAYRSLFLELKRVTVLDSLSAFCPSQKCAVFDEHGAILYADDDHLSTAGSRFQVKNLLIRYLESPL